MSLLPVHEQQYLDLEQRLKDATAALLKQVELKDAAIKRAEKAEARAREMFERTKERCAKICEKRAQERWEEHGITEYDTNASYYPSSIEGEMGAKDEESDDCAREIRALQPEATDKGD